MKKSENVYIILDWFDYNTNDLSHSADAFQLALLHHINNNFEGNSLTISKFDDNEHMNVEYALGIYDEAQGLLEKKSKFLKKNYYR